MSLLFFFYNQTLSNEGKKHTFKIQSRKTHVSPQTFNRRKRVFLRSKTQKQKPIKGTKPESNKQNLKVNS